MTKKRFIKLVMSYEIPRNKAQEIALEVKASGSYSRLILAKMTEFGFQKMSRCFGRVGITELEMTKAIADLFKALGEEVEQ